MDAEYGEVVGDSVLEGEVGGDSGVVGESGVVGDSGVVGESGVVGDSGVVGESGVVGDSGVVVGVMGERLWRVGADAEGEALEEVESEGVCVLGGSVELECEAVAESVGEAECEGLGEGVGEMDAEYGEVVGDSVLEGEVGGDSGVVGESGVVGDSGVVVGVMGERLWRVGADAEGEALEEVESEGVCVLGGSVELECEAVAESVGEAECEGLGEGVGEMDAEYGEVVGDSVLEGEVGGDSGVVGESGVVGDSGVVVGVMGERLWRVGADAEGEALEEVESEGVCVLGGSVELECEAVAESVGEAECEGLGEGVGEMDAEYGEVVGDSVLEGEVGGDSGVVGESGVVGDSGVVVGVMGERLWRVGADAEGEALEEVESEGVCVLGGSVELECEAVAESVGEAECEGLGEGVGEMDAEYGEVVGDSVLEGEVGGDSGVVGESGVVGDSGVVVGVMGERLWRVGADAEGEALEEVESEGVCVLGGSVELECEAVAESVGEAECEGLGEGVGEMDAEYGEVVGDSVLEGEVGGDSGVVGESGVVGDSGVVVGVMGERLWRVGADAEGEALEEVESEGVCVLGGSVELECEAVAESVGEAECEGLGEGVGEMDAEYGEVVGDSVLEGEVGGDSGVVGESGVVGDSGVVVGVMGERLWRVGADAEGEALEEVESEGVCVLGGSVELECEAVAESVGEAECEGLGEGVGEMDAEYGEVVGDSVLEGEVGGDSGVVGESGVVGDSGVVVGVMGERLWRVGADAEGEALEEVESEGVCVLGGSVELECEAVAESVGEAECEGLGEGVGEMDAEYGEVVGDSVLEGEVGGDSGVVGESGVVGDSGVVVGVMGERLWRVGADAEGEALEEVESEGVCVLGGSVELECEAVAESVGEAECEGLGEGVGEMDAMKYRLWSKACTIVSVFFS
ncbi:hypothetical protein EWB00_005695 [Schistosoma japonicum]|uniref:Uncharacterized protein n=1 Tax=Schistosoma japonicum TaxID=6182 RepID=A0A4Z2D0W5_SCHJA|nr:hypothetical protein EWB00_005695 [Schistosoma japonicum]